jgi:hypothetical protein
MFKKLSTLIVASIILLVFCTFSAADDQTHYDTESVKPNVVIAIDFRTSEAQIDQYSRTTPNNACEIDGVVDATKCVIYSGDSDFEPQLRPCFGETLLENSGDEMWVQFEFRFEDEWLLTDNLGFAVHKQFQLADESPDCTLGTAGHGELKFEMRGRYAYTDDSVVSVVDFRRYQNPSTDGNDGTNSVRVEDDCGISGFFNVQPGGDTWGELERDYTLARQLQHYGDPAWDCTDTVDSDHDTYNAFVQQHYKWIRYTLKWVNNSGEERVIVWADDEDNDPVMVLGGLTTPSDGYKFDYPTNDGFNQFWVEFNSSDERTGGDDLYFWFRNLIVSSSEIALGNIGGPQPVNPTMDSATISSGTTLTLAFNENVTQGAGYNDSDWDIDCTTGGNNISIAYNSGDGTTSHVYTISQVIYNGDSCNVDFNGDANSEEDGDGNDLAAIVSGTVTNNSTMHKIAEGMTISRR